MNTAHTVSGTCLGGPLDGEYYSCAWVYPIGNGRTQIVSFAVRCATGLWDDAIYERSGEFFLYVETRCPHARHYAE